MKKMISSVLALQMCLSSAAFAAPATQIDTVDVQAGLTSKLSKGQSAGWTYFDSNKKEMHTADALQMMKKDKDFYAVSPNTTEAGGKLGVHVRVSGDTKSITYVMSVGKSDLSSFPVARTFSINSKMTAEESRIVFIQTINSMDDEVKDTLKNNPSLLGLNSTSGNLLARTWNLLLPSASAGEIPSMFGFTSPISRILEYVAYVATGVTLFAGGVYMLAEGAKSKRAYNVGYQALSTAGGALLFAWLLNN